MDMGIHHGTGFQPELPGMGNMPSLLASTGAMVLNVVGLAEGSQIVGVGGNRGWSDRDSQSGAEDQEPPQDKANIQNPSPNGYVPEGSGISSRSTGDGNKTISQGGDATALAQTGNVTTVTTTTGVDKTKSVGQKATESIAHGVGAWLNNASLVAMYVATMEMQKMLKQNKVAETIIAINSMKMQWSLALDVCAAIKAEAKIAIQKALTEVITAGIQAGVACASFAIACKDMAGSAPGQKTGVPKTEHPMEEMTELQVPPKGASAAEQQKIAQRNERIHDNNEDIANNNDAIKKDSAKIKQNNKDYEEKIAERKDTNKLKNPQKAARLDKEIKELKSKNEELASGIKDKQAQSERLSRDSKETAAGQHDNDMLQDPEKETDISVKTRATDAEKEAAGSDDHPSELRKANKKISEENQSVKDESKKIKNEGDEIERYNSNLQHKFTSDLQRTAAKSQALTSISQSLAQATNASMTAATENPKAGLECQKKIAETLSNLISQMMQKMFSAWDASTQDLAKVLDMFSQYAQTYAQEAIATLRMQG